MFREEQGTWMIMLLTMVIFVYMFSLVYNFFLMSAYPEPELFRINALMGITNANFMKFAACGTWLGDFLTAWMVTDMMLQDQLYPSWARSLRAFWQSHGRTRIIVFWSGTVILSTVVISLIVSDYISWDYLNREFVATTELSRAFLASFILVMDLLIVMQDWDFPHFVCDLDIKLPGMHAASFKYRMFQKYVHLPEIVFHITGKWFNYGIIIIVMLLDLNMWKNQIFYYPPDYGQYTGTDNKVRTVASYAVLATGNRTLWTLENRQNVLNPRTNESLMEDDILMNSRYLGYPLSVKGLAFLPSLLGFSMFGVLTYLYGRFPPKTDATAGGRLRRRQASFRSSWKQGARMGPHGHPNARPMARLVVCWDKRCGARPKCRVAKWTLRRPRWRRLLSTALAPSPNGAYASSEKVLPPFPSCSTGVTLSLAAVLVDKCLFCCRSLSSSTLHECSLPPFATTRTTNCRDVTPTFPTSFVAILRARGRRNGTPNTLDGGVIMERTTQIAGGNALSRIKSNLPKRRVI
ncbi:transmembrane protein 117 [Ixodes scapularis]